jgi:hypothetical protein
MVQYVDILYNINAFGKYQKRNSLLLSLNGRKENHLNNQELINSPLF